MHVIINIDQKVQFIVVDSNHGNELTSCLFKQLTKWAHIECHFRRVLSKVMVVAMANANRPQFCYPSAYGFYY